MRYAYRRLPHPHALHRLGELQELATDGWQALRDAATVDHPRAVRVATGARVASAKRISDVRNRVCSDVAQLLSDDGQLRAGTGVYDRTLGFSLHSHLQLLPADAGRRETWNFLTLIVFPDLAAARWPDMQESRMLGGVRNAIERLWRRVDVLGDLCVSGDPPLREDELVGLFERSRLSRNPELVRALARAVLGWNGDGLRSDFARALVKRGVALTGAQLLDLLGADRIDELVAAQVPRAEGDMWWV